MGEMKGNRGFLSGVYIFFIGKNMLPFKRQVIISLY